MPSGLSRRSSGRRHMPETMDENKIADGLQAVAEGLQSIARALRDLGTSNAATEMGAIEFLSVKLEEGLHDIAVAITGHGADHA